MNRLQLVEEHFAGTGAAIDRTDGPSMAFADWRFNLRMSNTEPVLRLNVESRGDAGQDRDAARVNQAIGDGQWAMGERRGEQTISQTINA
ncbi:MAG: hypothetical protein EG824_10445 [Deltaproteobacteria bacterium]|nr:hypothetical protein [Deltaproteobacteria bacterium]